MTVFDASHHLTRLVARERLVLAKIARGDPLSQVLEDLLLAVEAEAGQSMRTSVLFVSEDTKHLHHGAAPSLPEGYNAAIDGIKIGEGVGSCGTAASRRTPVYATDIATDPLWVDFRDLARQHGLRACWSSPILAIDGTLLGTFATYYDEPRRPEPDDIEVIASVTQTAALAIDRSRSDAERRANEIRLRMAVEAGQIGEWELDLRTNRSFRARRHDQIFGYPEPVAEWGFDTFLNHVVAEDVAAVKAAYEVSAESGSGWNFQCRIRRKNDGEIRWITAHSAPQLDETGRTVKLYGMVQDITQQKLAEITLRASKEVLERQSAEQMHLLRLYRDIVQSTDVPICAFDTGYRLTAFNRAHSDEFYRIFGHRVSIGEVFPDLFPADQASVIRGFMTRALNGEVYTVTEEFGNPDLAKPAWEVSYSPLLDKDGNIIGAFHYAKDISARLRAEHELTAIQDTLRQAQKMEAVGQLTGGLAHDFNNLLAGISGSLELMQTRMRQGRFSDVERYIAVAQGAARRAAALTHRLLAFSRRQTLDPKPTDVNRLVADMQDLIGRTVGPSILIEVVGASGLWPALIDPPQLENALLNLCINARDAMPEGGRITIETANKWLDERAARHYDMPAGQYLSVCVTDTGTGMPPEVIARVFEPFYTTKPIGQGTGLGLSMIYGFAQQSGGQVRIYSELQKGTTVCLYLPRYYGEVPDHAIAEHSGLLSRSNQDRTVLVVDDEATVRMLVTEIVEDLGYTAIEAGDSAGGLKILQSDIRIDLLVTDVGLPGGMNGRQMADAARVGRPDLKVLFITGYAENSVFSNGYLASGMAMLTKPFAVDAMSTRIRSMLEDVDAI